MLQAVICQLHAMPIATDLEEFIEFFWELWSGLVYEVHF